MTQFDTPTEYQRRRWMRPNAHLYIRHDAWRFMPPGSLRHIGCDVVKYCEPDHGKERRQHVAPPANAGDWEEKQKVLLWLKGELLALRVDLKFKQAACKIALKAYNPDQPRVPAGNSDGGQWTGDGSSNHVRLAAGEPPRLGPHALAIIATEVTKRVIETFRKENGLFDLFGGRVGTVALAELNGQQIFGTNSTAPYYTSRDRSDAITLRGTLLEKYPDVMETDDVGRRPNDSVFHAEATVLLRAARENGGTLAGQVLEVRTDRPLCNSCQKVLPYVGLELGNPTVTFTDPTGLQRTIRNGIWVR